MKILSPKISVFGQPELQKQQAKQPQLPVPGNLSGIHQPDSFTRNPVQFAGHAHKNNHNNNFDHLYHQFSNSFQPVIQSALQKAKENNDRELNAEHLVWAAIKTLDDKVGWETSPGRHSRAGDRQDKELAEELTAALLPNHPNITPTEGIKLLRPLATEIAQDFDQDMTMDMDDPINMGLQRALHTSMKQAINAEESNIEPAPQALFRKILWQKPPIASFSKVANMAQRLIPLPQSSPQPPNDSLSNDGDEESITTESTKSSASTQHQWDEFQANLQEKSPALARWVTNSTKGLNHNPIYVNGKLPPLHHVILSGLEQADRELNPNGKRRPPQDIDKSQPFKNSLNALMPMPTDGPKLGRPFITNVLDRHRKMLQGMPMPRTPEQADAQAQRTRRVIDAFLNNPERDDYSLKAFVDYLKDEEAAADPGAPSEHAAIGKILTSLSTDATDTRSQMMEQFEKTVPSLLKNGTNMVRLGMDKQLPKVLLRRQAIDSMLAILGSGSSRTNIMLNAASGEGKTYAVQGLAQRIADNDVPPALKGAQMVQLNLGALKANTAFQGELETKVEDIFKQLNKYLIENPNRKVVLFVDEAHMLGDMMDTMKASGILEKPNLSFIGATTPDDWRKSPLKGDQAFQGRFQELSLPSFSKEEKLALLGLSSKNMANKNSVVIPPEVVELALDQATAKWPENGLRRATDLLGLAVSLAKNSTLEQASLKDQLELKELWLETLRGQKDLKGRFVRQMAEAQDEIKSLHHQIKEMDAEGKAQHPPVEDKHIRQAMAILTGERIGTLSQTELEKLHHAKEILGREIIGQDEALESAQQCLRKIAVYQKTGGTRNRPITSMLLCGPTGVGKTELTKVIARNFMNNNILRLDMSEYGEKHEIAKLLGSPPGYVGHENGGLIDQLRKTPNMVIVFDEIEKAHPDIFNILLPILEEGELRDNQGQIVSFRNSIIAMTSNLNQQQITKLITKSRQNKSKDTDPALANRELEKQVREMLTENASADRKGFKPEQLGRLDAVIPFSPLTRRNVSDILDIRLQEMNQAPFLKNNNLTVELSDRARGRLVELTAGGNPKAQDKPQNTAPQTNGAGRGGNRKKAEPAAEDNTILQGGARDVRNTFNRFVYDTVFTDLTFEPHLADLANAQLVVDYDPKTQGFQVKPKTHKLAHRTPSMMDFTPTGRTLAFA